MRIWDIPPRQLCKQHLLGEHRELHGLWNILTLNKQGYSRHPETLRWVGKLGALYIRHDALVKEMDRRGYNHKTPLDRRLAVGLRKQGIHIDEPEEQLRILKEKGCDCLQEPSLEQALRKDPRATVGSDHQSNFQNP